MRAAIIKLFENTVPESYKAGREVLHSILGRDVVQYDKPVFCFLSNQHLTTREDASPCVWETKEKVELGYKTVLSEPIAHVGHQSLMEFIGM